MAIAGIVLCEQLAASSLRRFIECLTLLAATILLAWMMRGKLRDLMIVTASLIFGLALLEGLALTVFRSTQDRASTIADDGGLSKARPLVGWGPTRPGLFRSTRRTIEGRLIYDTHVTIDDTLNRKTLSSEGPRPIAFFGDSWIYGDGVDDDGALPQIFADLTARKIPVLNLAFAGWSPTQNLLALQSGLYAPLLRSPRHFILFTATFHIERTACEGAYAASQSPRFVLEGSTVRHTGTCADHLGFAAPLLRIATGFALYKRIAPVLAKPKRQDVETYIKLVESFVATAKTKYDVPTTILFAPFAEDYIKGTGFTEAKILEELRKSGADVLVDKLPPIDDPSRYRIPGDGHPTKLANEARAQEIKDHLAKVDPAALEIIGE